MPTLQQAGKFAALLGIQTERGWALYTAQQTREQLFQRIVSVMQGKIIEVRLEQP